MADTRVVAPATQSLARRLARGMGYAAVLAPAGLVACGEAVTGRRAESRERWWSLARYLGAPKTAWIRRPGVGGSIGLGLAAIGLGLLGWFLLFLWGLAVVRGPFYGVIESGPVGPGTWGGPTMAGAWAVHAAVSVPFIGLLPVVIRALGLLHAAVVRKVAGQQVSGWVLPATILLGLLGTVLIASWLQQI